MSMHPPFEPASNAKITIVVPIYDHWESLSRCIQSLIDFTDEDQHRVFLVNDAGPNADEIERRVLEMIALHRHLFYSRNHKNLGFVGTCNRAVTELDESDNDVLLLNSDAELTAGALEEMHAVLTLAEHHGVVCARSNHATIATVPVEDALFGSSNPLPFERARALHATIAPDLPRYYLAPVAHGFCFLVRRSLIANHGLFDVTFRAGYNEENDFSLRVNALGYSSVIANRAFVYHLGSASFGAEVRNALEARNREILLERYPFYQRAVETFIEHGYAGADLFARSIGRRDGEPARVLIDVHHLSLVHNGSTRYALAFLEHLTTSTFASDNEITITAQQGAIDFFSLGEFGFRVIPYGQLTGAYDLGIALAPVNNLDQLFNLNRHSARWLVSHFDMIANRSWALRLSDPLRPLVVENGLRYADRIVSISEFSARDAQSYYPLLAKGIGSRTSSIPLGSTLQAISADGRGSLDGGLLPAGLASLMARNNYLVVMGNFYPHKQVRMALQALESTDFDVVAFGPVDGMADTQSRVLVHGGTLSEDQLGELLRSARVVIFPSAYEGFGLPIADALDSGRPVIAFDTSVAREVIGTIGGEGAVRLFRTFEELPELVMTATADEKFGETASALRGTVRSMADYGQEVLDVARKMLSTPIDVTRLNERVERIDALRQIASHHNAHIRGVYAHVDAVNARLHDVLMSRTYRVGAFIRRLLRPARHALRLRTVLRAKSGR